MNYSIISGNSRGPWFVKLSPFSPSFRSWKLPATADKTFTFWCEVHAPKLLLHNTNATLGAVQARFAKRPLNRSPIIPPVRFISVRYGRWGALRKTWPCPSFVRGAAHFSFFPPHLGDNGNHFEKATYVTVFGCVCVCCCCWCCWFSLWNEREDNPPTLFTKNKCRRLWGLMKSWFNFRDFSDVGQ